MEHVKQRRGGSKKKKTKNKNVTEANDGIDDLVASINNTIRVSNHDYITLRSEPWQDRPSADRENPEKHWQMARPLSLTHLCSQPPLFSRQGSASATSKKTQTGVVVFFG